MLSGRLGQGVALLVAALVGAGATYLLLSRIPPPEPELIPIDPQTDTCERAFGAVADITSYLADRAESDPAVAGHPLAGLAEEERDAAWADYIAQTGQYMEDTVDGFISSFGGEVQFLVEQFDRAGAWGEDLPREVVVVNEIGIRNLATHLDAAALAAGCER
jgi:hypothetical protein